MFYVHNEGHISGEWVVYQVVGEPKPVFEKNFSNNVRVFFVL